METCDQSLATESFSYSWFVNKTPSFDDLDEYLSSSSPRDTNFNFDTSISKSSSFNLVHADEIFSNGHIIPKYVERSKREEALSNSVTVPSIPISPFSSYQEDSSSTYCHFLKKWRKSSRQILHKFLGVFFRPFCQKVGLGCTRKSIRVDDMNRKVWEVQRQGSSVQAWPPTRKINKKIDYRRLGKVKSWSNLPREHDVPQSPSNSTNVFCDTENSISEAVLYCKRSIEN